ncbi:MAG: nucleoside monophosphate kinase [Elusimicrobiota bacterium]
MALGILLSALSLLSDILFAQNVVIQPVPQIGAQLNFAPVAPVAPVLNANLSLAPRMQASVMGVLPGVSLAPGQVALQTPSGSASLAPAQVALTPTKPLHLIILGPPGSGKGTYSKKMVEEYGMVHISAGELLREYAKTHPEIGKIMAEGKLVPTELLMGLLKERLSQDDIRRRGFILDGSPRRVSEAAMVESMLQELGMPVDALLRLEVPEEELRRRILARGRADDNETTLAERMRVYREQTLPVYDYFQGKVPFLTPSVAEADADVNYAEVRKSLAALRRHELNRGPLLNELAEAAKAKAVPLAGGVRPARASTSHHQESKDRP